MNHKEIINKLENNTVVIKALLNNISPAQAGWKPAPEKWAIVEVINHLIDEETDDFRQRLEFALLKPEREWKRIEPVKWVKEKNYIQRDMNSSLENFLNEREQSLRWLRDLQSPDWRAVDGYPFGMVLTAEQVLANWLTHDYLHIRQLNALNLSYLKSVTPGTDLSYAGNW